MKRIFILTVIITIVLGLSLQVNADLNFIGQGTSVHGTYNLIYDTDLDITWYDYTQSDDTWQNQVDWADALTVSFGGNIYEDWRLPTITQPDPNCSLQQNVGSYPLQSFGYNCTGSEMGKLFYTELGNVGAIDASGNLTECYDPSVSCLTYTGDFHNLQPLLLSYWSGTEYVSDTGFAWEFAFSFGVTDFDGKANLLYALAVRPGRAVSVIHEPIVYDSDQDWIIGDFELLLAIDDWSSDFLDDFELLELIDFWAAGSYYWNEELGSYQAGY